MCWFQGMGTDTGVNQYQPRLIIMIQMYEIPEVEPVLQTLAVFDCGFKMAGR